MTCLRFIIADFDSDFRLRDEADDLLVELSRSRRCCILCCPVATEVKLVVSLAREANDIWLGCCQQW